MTQSRWIPGAGGSSGSRCSSSNLIYTSCVWCVHTDHRALVNSWSHSPMESPDMFFADEKQQLGEISQKRPFRSVPSITEPSRRLPSVILHGSPPPSEPVMRSSTGLHCEETELVLIGAAFTFCFIILCLSVWMIALCSSWILVRFVSSPGD